MKKLVALLVLAGALVFAGGPDWETNLEIAKEMARKENKTILVNFSGSDWCGWCKKLDREVFRKQTFLDFAEKKLVLVQVDFPRYKRLSKEQQKANLSLQKKYRIYGFPAILLVDADEKVLLKTGYRPGGAANYIDHLKSFIN